jgi:hypothetical protein
MLIEFVWEQVMERLIELRKIANEANIADVLTKLIVGKTSTMKAMYLLGKMGMELKSNSKITWLLNRKNNFINLTGVCCISYYK